MLLTFDAQHLSYVIKSWLIYQLIDSDKLLQGLTYHCDIINSLF